MAGCFNVLTPSIFYDPLFNPTEHEVVVCSGVEKDCGGRCGMAVVFLSSFVILNQLVVCKHKLSKEDKV